MKLYIHSDCRISLLGLRDNMTGLYINDATVTGRVIRDGVQITDDLTFTYKPDSRGDYITDVDNSLALAEKDGILYYLEVTVVCLGKTTTFRERVEPVYKSENN